MRLSEGWIPIWRSDVQKFFQRSPNTFVVFHHLVANAQFGAPYEAMIRGKGRVRIEVGDVLTSKGEIREAWGYDSRTLRRALDELVNFGLIKILFEDAALLVRIEQYQYFIHTGPVSERPPFESVTHVELHATHGELHGSHVELHASHVKSHDTHVILSSTCTKVSEKSTSTSASSPTKLHTNNKNKDKETKNEKTIYIKTHQNPQSKDSSHSPKPKTKDKTRTWALDDPLAKVFTNLTKLSICKARFDTEDYRKWIQGLIERYGISISEIEVAADDWQTWHNDKTDKPVSPKGSFNTWIRNYTERRNRNGSSRKPQPTVIDDNPDKWANVNSDRPW